MKLLALAEALKDADEAIKVDPSFGALTLVIQRTLTDSRP